MTRYKERIMRYLNRSKRKRHIMGIEPANLQLPSMLKGKSVILVGPSANVKKDCKDIRVDGYDVVIRLNLHYKINERDKAILGRRTDIIYHCMNVDQYNRNDVVAWKRQRIHLVMRNDFKKTPRHKKTSHWNRCSHGLNPSYSIINDSFFNHYKKEMGCNPSTGVLAMFHILSFDVKKLTVVGFDFYRTLYHNKNDKSHLTKIQNNQVGNHNPNKQLEYIKKVRDDLGDKFDPQGFFKQLLEED